MGVETTLSKKLSGMLGELALPNYVNYYEVTQRAFIIALLAFAIGALMVCFFTKKESASCQYKHSRHTSGATKFIFFAIITGLFVLAMYALYQFMLSKGLKNNEFSGWLQIFLDALVALFVLVCICRYNRHGIVISTVVAVSCFVLLFILIFFDGLDLKYSGINDYNLSLLNVFIVMLAADVILGLVSIRTTLLVNSEEVAAPPSSKCDSNANSTTPEFAFEQTFDKKTVEPEEPKTGGKYTIYSCDEVPVIAKRVLDDMPSDIFGITLLSLKKSMLDKLTREKDDFKPGEDIRFFVYRAFYSHTYDLLLRDDCYFMGDFSELGREIYRLCTFCLDESHRLGYVDDELYKAQRNNISINVRNGKEFS